MNSSVELYFPREDTKDSYENSTHNKIYLCINGEYLDLITLEVMHQSSTQLQNLSSFIANNNRFYRTIHDSAVVKQLISNEKIEGYSYYLMKSRLYAYVQKAADRILSAINSENLIWKEKMVGYINNLESDYLYDEFISELKNMLCYILYNSCEISSVTSEDLKSEIHEIYNSLE